MKIEIPEEQISDMFGAAILESLSQEVREDLIKGAIAYLLTAEKGRGYGAAKSPMQEAFETALDRFAGKFAVEYVAENPEVKAMIVDALPNLTNAPYDRKEKVIEAIAKALAEVMLTAE
jgi:uncharacterized protein YtpQ (UPF0354 family)